MATRKPGRQELLERIAALEGRLWEAEQAISAIRGGEVDALVVEGPEGDRLYTLSGADYGYRVVVESMNEGAVIFAPDYSIYYCNGSFAEMLQVPIQKIIGANLESCIDEQFHYEIKEIFRKGRDSGKAVGEFQLKRADGTTLPVRVSINFVNLENFPGICAIITDLADQKKKERELRTTAEQLRRSNEDLSDFAFIASHDLQEPLRKIRTFGDLIVQNNRHRLDSKGRDFLDRIQKSATRMQQFIFDLLKYSRLSCASTPLDVVDLREAAVEAASDLEVKIEAEKAGIDISDLPSIEAEKSQMQQLFQNLMANSLKFRGKEAPRIRIYSQADSRECRIFVEDNGIGFEEIFSEKIFTPFQRLCSRSAYEGTGMGLAICRKIVERHGGSITARSEPGTGSTFIITLPLKQSR